MNLPKMLFKSLAPNDYFGLRILKNGYNILRENNQNNTPDSITADKIDGGKELDDVKDPNDLVGTFFSITYTMKPKKLVMWY